MSNRGSAGKVGRALALWCAFGAIGCVGAERDAEPRWLVLVGSTGTSLGYTTTAGESGESTVVGTTTITPTTVGETTGSSSGGESGTETGTCGGDDLDDLRTGEADYPAPDGCGGGDTGGEGGGEESGGDTGIQCADDPPPFDLGKRDSDPKSGVFINNGTNDTVVVTVTFSHPCVKGRTISLLEVPRNKTVHITVGNDLDAEGWTVTITKGGKDIKPDEGKKKVKWKIGDTVKEGEIKAKTVTFE